MTATSSNQEMQVSVSFGKFENDSLSWEKYSSFSPNKYLEEVEKCATPGSVAQKKAYFETHYKKIAERKAEIIMEQERIPSFRPSVQDHENIDSEIDKSMMIESSGCDGSNGESTSEKDKPVTSYATEVNEASIHDPLEETPNFEECQSAVDAVDDQITLNLEKLERVEEKPELIVQVEDKEKPEEVVCIEKPEEVVCMEVEVKEDISSKDTDETNETPMTETKKEKDHKVIKKTYKNVQTKHIRDSPKPNQMNKKPVASKIVTSKKTQPSKEKTMTRATNKASTSVSKAQFSTPRVSKPSSTISSTSTPRSSVKKENISTLPRKKQTAPNSLHKSLNLGQPGSDPTALATTRKSLIMERMGDKDIVRRAFKTFQKSFDQLKPSSDGKDTTPKQVPAKKTSVSSLATASQKENGRLDKSDGMEKKGANSHHSTSFVPKGNRIAATQELSRTGTRAVQRINLQAKQKAEATNAKPRRQHIELKAKSMQGPLSKGSSDKIL